MTPGPSERVAAIDVGTNTVLLTVAERHGRSFVPVIEQAEITRLGRGVDRTGRLDPGAIADTVAVIARYAALARSLGATRIAAVATSAARDAGNGAEFFEAARASAGLVPEVIAGGEEARLVHLSAWGDFGVPGQHLAVLDVGGGSSELTWGEGPVPDGRRSFQMGAVRLTERVSPADPPTADDLRRMREAARGALAEVAEIRASGALDGARLVAVAGTVTTLAAVAQALPAYDALRVHGSSLAIGDLVPLLERLAALSTADRARLPGMEPKRADVIVAGAVLVVATLELGGFASLTVSDRGVRWGLLHDRFGAGAPVREGWAVVCDFDGTALTEDLGDAVSQHFAGQAAWRRAEDEYRDGAFPFGELLRRIFEPITASAVEIAAFARERAVLRPGFEPFLAACAEAGRPFVVCSAGLDVYIEPVLARLPARLLAHLELRSNRAHCSPSGMRVEFHQPARDDGCGRCGFCKGSVVRELQAAGHRVVMCGDGTADCCAADAADFTFATRHLVEHCRERGLVYRTFQDFHEVMTDFPR